MYSCEIWANADPFCAGADPCIRNFVGHPRYELGTILLCYQYINLLRPMYSCEIWGDADPFCAGADLCIRNLSDIYAMYWELYYYVTNILICCGQCIAVKFGQMPIHSVQVPIHASEICWTSMLCIRNMSDIHAMYWESYYYVTNILICCGRCIAVKFGQMPIHSVQVPIHASEICQTSTLCIRHMSDIHAMYWESYYYVTNILIFCDRCIAVKFGQMPIHSVQVPIRASEICRTSTLCIRNYTTMLPIYYFAVADV